MGERNVPYDRSLAIAKRHGRLLELIEAGGLSAAALAKALGVSEATINRDVGFMRGKGHRISSRRVASGWAFAITPPEASLSSVVEELK
jgi:DeoR/GlpR family transcriptional regulator of sugar metabolism